MLFDDQRVDLARVTHAEANALRRRTGFVFQSYNLFRQQSRAANRDRGLIIARKSAAPPGRGDRPRRAGQGRHG